MKVWGTPTRDKNLLTLKGYTRWSISVAVSPDGKRIVSGGDKTVKVWEADTGQDLLTLAGHSEPVNSVALSSDGKRIVSGSGGSFTSAGSLPGVVKVWDSATGQNLLTLAGHRGWVTGVAISRDGKRIVSGSWDNTVKVWDADTGLNLLTLNGHTGIVTSVAMSPDGKRIVSGSWDKTLRVWDAHTGQILLTPQRQAHGHCDQRGGEPRRQPDRLQAVTRR